MTFVLLTSDMCPYWRSLTDPKIIEAHVANKTVPETNPPATTSGGSEEGKDQNLRYNLSKFEYDLYHEEDDVAEKVVRVKRVSMPNKGEKWKIFEDNKVVFVLEGAKLTNKEKEFLRSIDGVNFLIGQAKQGIKSFNALRTELKKKITTP
jgi:hypothetical protein